MTVMIQDQQFIAAQKLRMLHLQDELAKIVTEMKTIQEFLDGYEARSHS